MRTLSSSPPSKRLKLESLSPTRTLENHEERSFSEEIADAEQEHQCSICLEVILDRTVIPTCSHEFCFECLLVWSEQSRRCPLCSQAIGQYVIHNIRSRYDFRKHYLTPLRASPEPLQGSGRAAQERIRQRRTARARERDMRMREEREESDKLERSIAKRRWIYRHDLYAKHVASNSYTKYRPYPTPAQFTASTELISRTTIFLRRELRVWDDLDVEFLTSFIISLMKSIDIRSESAVKLLAEFLDMDAPYVEGGRHVNAEHFAHEVYSYVRSPFRDLFVYDTVAQYDTPPGASSPELRRDQRWRESSRSRSPSRSRSRHVRSSSPPTRDRRRGHSLSWSPSGRIYPSISTHERSLHVPRTSESEHARRRSRERSAHRDYNASSRDDLQGRARSPEPRRTNAKHEPNPDENLNHVNPRRYSRRLNAKREPRSDKHHTHDINHYQHDRKSTKRDLSAGRSPTQGGSHDIIKGKERAGSELYSRIDVATQRARSGQMQAPEITETQDSSKSPIHPTTSDSAPPKPHAPDRKRPPRNRNLLESVQAHLTLRPREHSSRMKLQNVTSILPESRPPSLQTDTSQSLMLVESSNPEPSTSGKDTILQNGTPAPEITARTRARHARNDLITSPSVTVQSRETGLSLLPNGGGGAVLAREEKETGALPGKPATDIDVMPELDRATQTRISQASESINARKAQYESPTSGPSSALIPLHESHYHVPPSDPTSGISVNDTINAISYHPSISSLGIRTRLLAKLEEEKNRARGTATAAVENSFPKSPPLDRTSPGSADRLSVNEGPFTDPNAIDTQFIEAKLRTRAQLQVRLAAEKKSSRA